MAVSTTIQSGIKHHENDNITDYALFMGGTNVTHDVLMNYDPLKTGYGRLFMVRKPVFLEQSIPTQLKKFKHILEYGNTAVQGINDVSVNFNQITGGYVGKSFEIPSVATDDTNSFTVNCYEFSGSPIREVIHTWINGTTDLLTGFAHYNGVQKDLNGGKLQRIQANQTAEFIYVSTDNTGQEIEYACLFANCFPRGIKNDQFNYTAGEHNLVEYNIEFTCTKYESLHINKVAQELIRRYRLLANSLNFNSGITVANIKPSDTDTYGGYGMQYNVKDGKFVKYDESTGTNGLLTPLSMSNIEVANT